MAPSNIPNNLQLFILCRTMAKMLAASSDIIASIVSLLGALAATLLGLNNRPTSYKNATMEHVKNVEALLYESAGALVRPDAIHARAIGLEKVHVKGYYELIQYLHYPNQ